MLGMARNAFSWSRYRSRLTLMKSITLSMRDATPLGGGRGVGADCRHRKLQMKSKSAVVGALDFERAAVRLHDLTARGKIARTIPARRDRRRDRRDRSPGGR